MSDSSEESGWLKSSRPSFYKRYNVALFHDLNNLMVNLNEQDSEDNLPAVPAASVSSVSSAPGQGPHASPHSLPVGAGPSSQAVPHISVVDPSSTQSVPSPAPSLALGANWRRYVDGVQGSTGGHSTTGVPASRANTAGLSSFVDLFEPVRFSLTVAQGVLI